MGPTCIGNTRRPSAPRLPRNLEKFISGLTLERLGRPVVERELLNRFPEAFSRRIGVLFEV